MAAMTPERMRPWYRARSTLSVVVRTANVPTIEAMIATPPSTRGYSATAVWSVNVRTPSSMTATAVTAYVSNRSAAMPAQSPTLSPTLSAITAGLRGSSSGMPASTLPTRSAPTSAAFVKMSPPRRGAAAAGHLGDGAAPQTGEDRHQRPAEAEADEGVDGVLRALVEERGQDAV